MDSQAVEDRTGALVRLLKSRSSLLVLTHANPDPDSLASAAGLRLLAEETAGIPTAFGYCGRVLRAENREMVQSCAIDMVPQSDLDLAAFDCVGVVDTQPGFGHTHLPVGQTIDIVIDHHVPPEQPASGFGTPAFADLRTYVGATSTLVTNYLIEADVEVPQNVATALFYGIRTDTADLSRNVSELDETAYTFLAPRIDRQALARITTPALTPDYFRSLRTALNNVRIYGDVVMCSMGPISSPEMVAEVADLLLRLEGEQNVFVGGLVGDTYYMSVRTEGARDAYYLIGGALDGEGSFGGHGSVAGGSVKMPDHEERTLKRLERRLERNIQRTMGVEGQSVAGLGGNGVDDDAV